MRTAFSRRNYLSRITAILLVLVLGEVFFPGCESEADRWKLKSAELLIGEYIDANPELYSEFGKIVDQAGAGSFLRIRGPFTLFLPTNEAMKAYYRESGVDEVNGFPCETTEDTAFLKQLVFYHLILVDIPAGDIGLGAIRELNANGDRIASEFDGSSIILNKRARITHRDIITANGYIHEIDRVLDPVNTSVYETVAMDPGLSIFAEGLRRTGIKDTLNIIEFPFGKAKARTRFTLLAVPDTLYQRMGINNVEDLIQLYAEPGDTTEADLKKLNNGFYRYMEYHCVNGTNFLSDFVNKLYPVLSMDNSILVSLDTDYKLNYDSRTKQYTGFYIPQSNVPARNGAIHIVNSLLPVTTPEKVKITMRTTDFFDLQEGDYYRKHYARWNDGQNTFSKIKWEGDYLLYYYNHEFYECLSMNGWFSLSITFPKVPKGKYEVSIYQPAWGDVTDCRAIVDGEITKYIYKGPRGSGTGGLQKIADVDWPTTSEHTITMQNVTYGMIFWEYIQFNPVK
ncbi:MAG: fasciclin domain-containing protein [Bacteroidales bacterium]